MNDLGKTSQYRLTAARTAQEADGRKHRSQKSQTLIVNAMLELVAQGNLEPSADQIADIAKVGRRSVFRHFSDMDTLYREMINSVAATMESIVQQPFVAAHWHGQVLELVDRRAMGFEKLKPFLLAEQVHRHRSPFLKAAHAKFGESSERSCWESSRRTSPATPFWSRRSTCCSASRAGAGCAKTRASTS